MGAQRDHADLSWEVYEALGGTGDPLDVAEGALIAEQGVGRPTFERCVLACLDRYCIAETLAAPLFRSMGEVAKEDAPKQALIRIVDDLEAQAALGWAILDEAIEQDAKLVSTIAKKHLPVFFTRVERAWGVIPDRWVEPVGPHEKRYGLIPRARYKREFYQAIAEEVLPRLESRNLAGRTAWGRRKKG